MATQVILQTNVHCDGCARKIRRTARSVYGVEDVWASPETGVVVVTGNADAESLRLRIEHETGRTVTVVSDGADQDQAPDSWWRSRLASPWPAPPPPPDSWWASSSSRHATPLEAPDHWRMAHLLAPSRHVPPPPPMQGYPPYVHLAEAPPQYATPYSPQVAYPYRGSSHGSQWSLV